MADPVTATMAGVGIVGNIAGGFIGAEGAKTTADAQAAAANFKAEEYQYQAGVAKANQIIAERNAAFARFSGEVQAQEGGMKLRAEIGTTKAMQGAGGLDVNSGSDAAVRASEYNVGQQNIAIVRNNAAKVAYGYDVEAFQANQQAAWDVTGSAYEQQAAQFARKAGNIAAIGSIIGGVSSVSSKFAGAYTSGMFTPPGYNPNAPANGGISGSYLSAPGGAGT